MNSAAATSRVRQITVRADNVRINDWLISSPGRERFGFNIDSITQTGSVIAINGSETFLATDKVRVERIY